MNKNTLTFERKLYVAPACKTHVLQIEENIMSYENDNHTPYFNGGGLEDDYETL